jgi:hypothetical protein
LFGNGRLLALSKQAEACGRAMGTWARMHGGAGREEVTMRTGENVGGSFWGGWDGVGHGNRDRERQIR